MFKFLQDLQIKNWLKVALYKKEICNILEIKLCNLEVKSFNDGET